ncbi:N-alpha-acetyltransferase 30 isoform 1-T1 [Pelodytes ibericus]
MADAPSGPSVLSQYPGAGLGLTTACDPGEEQEEEERHHQHQQLNGLISPDLRHLKAVSLKNKYRGPQEPTGLPLHDRRTSETSNGLDRVQDPAQESLSACLAACTLRGDPDHHEEEEDGITIRYERYESEFQMPDIMRLITRDLSEPYSIYTYRYFIHNWPQLCFLAMVEEECVGAIVCKLDMHKKMFRRGYIAMLAVDSKYRRKGIGTNLVKKAIYAMVEGDCDEVVLETEITNKSALKLYENLGFVRDKRLFRYYLNGVDALRLKLWLR